MKTLVIHPSDTSTHFLTKIYEGRGWTIINENPSTKVLKEQIKAHDRIIMLGHGSEGGLIGYDRFIIDSSLVYLLREKDCVCIWCNSDVFVEKYDLKGFYTGMIISEYDEAYLFSIGFKGNEIEESNIMFADVISKTIDKEDMLSESKRMYVGESEVINFNTKNLYQR